MIVFACATLVGCANVSTTRLTYSRDGATMTIEMPKELEAKNLRVELDPATGKATLSADAITTRNVETIKAQGQREAQAVKAAGTLAEKVSEGAAKGAVKGLVP